MLVRVLRVRDEKKRIESIPRLVYARGTTRNGTSAFATNRSVPSRCSICWNALNSNRRATRSPDITGISMNFHAYCSQRGETHIIRKYQCSISIQCNHCSYGVSRKYLSLFVDRSKFAGIHQEVLRPIHRSPPRLSY